MIFSFASIRPAQSAVLLLAGAAVLAAPLFFFSTEPPVALVAPAAPRFVPAPRDGMAARSYSYYPEQLAALSSLNSFSPVADAGRPAQAAAGEPTAPRRVARIPEAPHRAETQRRPAPLATIAAPLASPAAAQTAEPAPKQDGWKVFGLTVPKPGWPDGEALRSQAASWRDAAASLPGKAADHVARLWPLGRDARPAANPATDSPPAAN